jgi:hypothetical protein
MRRSGVQVDVDVYVPEAGMPTCELDYYYHKLDMARQVVAGASRKHKDDIDLQFRDSGYVLDDLDLEMTFAGILQIHGHAVDDIVAMEFKPSSEGEAIREARESGVIPDGWAGNERVVLAAVRVDCAALLYAEERLRTSRLVVAAAVKSNPFALSLAHRSLVDRLHFVLKAAVVQPFCMNLVSESLRGDPVLARRIAMINADAVAYMTMGVRRELEYEERALGVREEDYDAEEAHLETRQSMQQALFDRRVYDTADPSNDAHWKVLMETME